jgi:hypothetical protein
MFGLSLRPNKLNTLRAVTDSARAGCVWMDRPVPAKPCRIERIRLSGIKVPRKGSATYRRKACSLKSAALATTSATTARGL